MANIRPLNAKKYNISKNRFLENYYFCLRFNEDLSKEDRQLIIDTARETDDELSEYIVKAVTNNLTYRQLVTLTNIPCCHNTYYDRRRRFYYLLSKKR